MANILRFRVPTSTHGKEYNMKSIAWRLFLVIFVVLSERIHAGDGENVLLARASKLNAEIGKMGVNLELAQSLDQVVQQIRSDLSNVGNPGRVTLRALLLTVVRSKVDPTNSNAVPIFEFIVSSFEKASDSACWSDLEATRLKSGLGDVYGGMAQWIKSVREILVVGYKEQVLPPPTLPASISSTYYGGIPEPSIIKDPQERDAYSKQYEIYKANERNNIIQRNLPGIIAKAELALFTSMKVNPAKDIVDSKYMLQIMTKAGATKERIAELNKAQ